MVSGAIALFATCTGIILLVTFLEMSVQSPVPSQVYPIITVVACIPIAIWFGLRRFPIEKKKRRDAARKAREQQE